MPSALLTVSPSSPPIKHQSYPGFRDKYRHIPDLGLGIGYGHGQPHQRQRPGIDPVITDIGHFREFDPGSFPQFFQDGDLAVMSGKVVFDSKPLDPRFHCSRVESSDHGKLDAHRLGQLDAEPVLNIEPLGDDAFGVIVQATIGEHTVHIQDDHAHLSGRVTDRHRKGSRG